MQIIIWYNQSLPHAKRITNDHIPCMLDKLTYNYKKKTFLSSSKFPVSTQNKLIFLNEDHIYAYMCDKSKSVAGMSGDITNNHNNCAV